MFLGHFGLTFHEHLVLENGNQCVTLYNVPQPKREYIIQRNAMLRKKRENFEPGHTHSSKTEDWRTIVALKA